MQAVNISKSFHPWVLPNVVPTNQPLGVQHTPQVLLHRKAACSKRAVDVEGELAVCLWLKIKQILDPTAVSDKRSKIASRNEETQGELAG